MRRLATHGNDLSHRRDSLPDFLVIPKSRAVIYAILVVARIQDPPGTTDERPNLPSLDLCTTPPHSLFHCDFLSSTSCLVWTLDTFEASDRLDARLYGPRTCTSRCVLFTTIMAQWCV